MKIEIPIGLLVLGLAAVPALSGRSSLLPSAGEAEVGSTIPAFQAQAISTVDSRATLVPTVYMIIGVNCGATPAYEKRFKALEDEYRSRGVDLVWVFPNRTESHEAKLGWMQKLGLKGPMIDDEGAKITQSLGCKQTAQAILADAIRETLAKKPVSVPTARAFG